MIPVKVSRGKIDIAVVILAACSLVVLIAYTCYSRSQWLALEASLREAERANKIAEENGKQARQIADRALQEATRSTQLAERAWVTVRTVNSSGTLGKEKMLITATIQNTGKTPARIVDTRFSAHSFSLKRPFPIPPPHGKMKDPEPSRVVIAPSVTMHTWVEVEQGVDADLIDIPKVLDGAHRLYVYGHLVYTDIFGQTRTTTFCWFLRLPGTWVACPVYNDAD